MKKIKYDSYDEYVATQVKVNKKKIHNVWASYEELMVIAKCLRNSSHPSHFGVCHGARNGHEVRVLRLLTDAEVIGTDIAETAFKFDNMIQMDFHDDKPEWHDKVDFIYSNSWDHSYDFDKMLGAWLKCINPEGGKIFIPWCDDGYSDSTVHAADCLGISFDELVDMVKKQAKIEAVLAILTEHHKLIKMLVITR